MATKNDIPNLPSPIEGTYTDSENMELLLRAIVDQWERKEDVEGDLPSYFIDSVMVDYVEGLTTNKNRLGQIMPACAGAFNCKRKQQGSTKERNRIPKTLSTNLWRYQRATSTTIGSNAQ